MLYVGEYIINRTRGLVRHMKSAMSLVCAAMCSLVVSATFVHAASFALLVGVSDYEEQSGIDDLRGPVNDVMILRDSLAARGAFDIRILADGIDGAEIPTRAAILRALKDLANQAVSGDFVFIHFSGHGTQQPDQNGDESDGLDEVFLPADTQRATAGSRQIPNGITDDALGAAVAAIRAKGADVWFVLDSCHSGSGLRASSPGVATRFVDPTTLGINVSATVPASQAASPIEEIGGVDLPGKYLAFYAAQSSELAREIEIDQSAASGNGWYGLFTSRLAARLSQDASMSYRQLFQAVLGDINNGDIQASARLQTPLWEGDLIDATVFGGKDTIGLRQFAVAGDRLSAGLLHGLNTGTVVSLVRDASAAPDETVGTAQIVSATAQSATLAPVSEACVPDPTSLCAPDGTLPDYAQFARVLAQPIDLTLHVAVPVSFETGRALAPGHPLRVALADAIARVNAGAEAKISLVETTADIEVGSSEYALWFGQAVKTGASPIGLRWDLGHTDLDPLLVRMFKAEQIARMLETVDTGGSILFGAPVDVEIKHRDTDMSNRPSRVLNRDDLVAECQTALSSASVSNLPARSDLNQCDQLHFAVQGVVQGPARDVNRIYIDSQYCVGTAYVRLEGVSTQAQLGSPMTVCSDCPSERGIAQKAGYERLFVVITEARDNSESLDLRGLLDTCSESTNTRSAGPTGPAAAFLQAVGTRAGTRGSFDGMGITGLWVERYDWQVLPRSEAKRRDGIAED